MITHRNVRGQMRSIFPYFAHVDFETHVMQQMFEHSIHWVLINLKLKQNKNMQATIFTWFSV